MQQTHIHYITKNTILTHPSQGITFDEVRGAVQRARMSTRTRVAALEEEVGSGWG